MSRRIAAGAVLAVFAVGAIAYFVPSLTLKRVVVTSTPSLDGLTLRAAVNVPRHRTACIRPVPLDPGARFVHMLVSVKGGRTWPLDLTLRGGDFVAHGRFAGYPPNTQTPVVARLDRAPSQAQRGELCVRNTGRRTVSLVGTNEPALVSLPTTYLGGTPVVDVDPAIAFTTGQERSIVQRRTTIVDHTAAFTGVMPAWLIWPLALLFVLGLPAGVAWALLISARSH
jgi:hypothetical protein